MTISSHEYQSSTDDDIFLWHHTENAKNLLEFISSGHDAGDEKLPSDALEGKYQGKVLEEKSRNFAKLKIEEQKDILLSGITGDVTGKAKQIKDAPAHVLIITKVRFFLGKLQEIGKFDEWINRSPWKMFIRLPLEEKEKYHNALIAFHDQCKRDGQPSSAGHSMDSSPYDQGEGCPDFEDKSKWEAIED